MVHDLGTIKIAVLMGTDTGVTFPSVWSSPTTDGSMPKDVKADPDQWLQVRVSNPDVSHRTNPYWPKRIGDRFWIRLDSTWSDGRMRASVALKTWGLEYEPWREPVTPPEYGETKKYKTEYLSAVRVQCEKIHNTQTEVYVVTVKGCDRPDVFDNWAKLMEVLGV